MDSTHSQQHLDDSLKADLTPHNVLEPNGIFRASATTFQQLKPHNLMVEVRPKPKKLWRCWIRLLDVFVRDAPSRLNAPIRIIT